MSIQLLVAGVSGLILGIFCAGLVFAYLYRGFQQKHRQAKALDDAVASERLESRDRDLASAHLGLKDTEQRLATRDTMLQRALLAEAALDKVVEGLRAEVNGLSTRLSTAGELSSRLAADNTAYREQIAHLQTRLSEQEKQNHEKLELLEQAGARLKTEFTNLANQIFDAKQRTFREQNQTHLDGLLAPLSERIKDFEKRVEETYNKESNERFSLIREVRNLQDLNARISKDAVNLTNALKGENKAQGTWGEVILERVLEKSGLEKGREYEIQVSLTHEDGSRQQPDVVVRLPEDKDVVIDAKVSLVAWEKYCSLETETGRTEALKAHVQSLRQHVRQLGAKDYQKLYGLRTLDFVLLFVPIEPAFSTAVQQDPELFSDAFRHNIMVVSPSTLHATLRMIHNIWRFEQQNNNAQEIARRAGALYDKFVNFVADLEEIGARVASVQTAYDKAHNKLVAGKGNLISRAEGMRELGAKVSKTLPQNLVEMPVRDSNREARQ